MDEERGREVYSPAQREEDSKPHRQHHLSQRRATLALQRVSKRAALAGKRKIWDSNDASIDAVQSAVDGWESAYNALRGVLVTSFHSAKGVYGAAKTGVHGLEHGLLAPVRDWVLLPAFGGMEHAVGSTIGFLESPQAAHLAQQSLGVVQRVPVVGDNVLAPTLVKSVEIIQQAWHIAQYPIPSRTAVRSSVDNMLTTTKWALTTAGREVSLYAKRLDANITRTLMHTQWRVLGSGPYSTLDNLHKLEIVDHICERYLSTEGCVARYELAAHIRAHNKHLYKDVVLTGLLRERGGEATREDLWLEELPSYRSMVSAFLLNEEPDQSHVEPIYFRLAYQNGKRPGKDVPWTRIPERKALEQAFQAAHHDRDNYKTRIAVDDEAPVEESHPASRSYTTVARWYSPDFERDVLVDQRRQAVSILPACPSCRTLHESFRPPLQPKGPKDLCEDCQKHSRPEQTSIFPPSFSLLMRPTLWRFHGPGDEVRRGLWCLDTQRHGLQPYGEEASAVLEDAYLFLKWKAETTSIEDDSLLLTVQVSSPDGLEQQLVQFSSLQQVTAIQKTLGGAVSLFKRRVYRGVSFPPRNDKKGKPSDGSDAFESVSIGSFDISGELDSPVSNAEIHVDFNHPLALPHTVLKQKTEEEVNVDNQDEDNIGHLVLIVHGIGEMMRSIDVFGISLPNMSSIVDCCGYLRKNHDEVYKRHDSLASVSGRVEYLPVEWHEAFALQSRRQPCTDLSPAKKSTRSHEPTMNDISLRTILNLRDFANDTLLDVLFFMSPMHHDIIIDIVTNELNVVVQRFAQVTGFAGKVSVIGHSLGSIIAWDILSNQIPPPAPAVEFLTPDDHSPVETLLQHRIPELRGMGYPQLSFQVDAAFMLGSPISVFLMIRNQRNPLSEEFYLPGCRRVFNIFHPYDPVAYRIEPLLEPRNADIEPSIVPHWYGGYRAIYKTKRLWQRIVDETVKTQQNVVEALEAHMTGIGLLDAAYQDEYDLIEESSSEDTPRNAVCGNLNQGRRIDYKLQEREIEHANEYVSALAAHSCYWSEKDLSLFVAREIARSSLEAVVRDDESG